MSFTWTEPVVTEAINRLSYQWDSLSLLVEADRLTDAGQAELWFYHPNETGNKLLHIAKVNLLASSTMTQLAKRMVSHSEDVPWTQVLTYITKTAMEYQRRGEPGVLLQPVSAEALKPVWLIEPLIIKGVPNIIFGEKGVNKTTLCLTALGILELGDQESPCGLAASLPAKVGMLDWETTKELTNFTLARLIEGQTIPYFELCYLRCKHTLSEEIDRVANFIHDNRIEVLLIDSLGQAAGSDKFDSSGKAAALRFFELRGKKDDLNEDQFHTALFHQESNYTKKYPPLGFLLDYSETTIRLTSEEVSLSQFLERASQTKKLLELLQEGAKSVQAISNALSLSDRRSRALLSRLKKRGLVIDLGSGMWGLLQKGENI